MNQRQIVFSAELVDNKIKIELTAENNNQELAIEAANKLFASLQRVGIEVTRKNLEQDW